MLYSMKEKTNMKTKNMITYKFFDGITSKYLMKMFGTYVFAINRMDVNLHYNFGDICFAVNRMDVKLHYTYSNETFLRINLFIRYGEF